jgi:hypothetical protein
MNNLVRSVDEAKGTESLSNEIRKLYVEIVLKTVVDGLTKGVDLAKRTDFRGAAGSRCASLAPRRPFLGGLADRIFAVRNRCYLSITIPRRLMNKPSRSHGQ